MSKATTLPWEHITTIDWVREVKTRNRVSKSDSLLTQGL